MGRVRSRFHQSIFRADPNGDPDINTTPLIDVMLVMLVMFIITIPPPTHSVDITLPIGGHAEVRDENRVTIDTSDVIRWASRWIWRSSANWSKSPPSGPSSRR